MSIMQAYIRSLIKKQADKINPPQPDEDEFVRLRITFTGRVQHVGFRRQLKLIAEIVGVTGTVRNAGENTVISEAQGTRAQLDALMLSVRNERRFVIDSAEKERLDPVAGETGFKIIY